MVPLHCWTCRHRHVQCDGEMPCSPCKSIEAKCPGPRDAAAIGEPDETVRVDPQAADNVQQGILARVGPDPVPDEVRVGIAWDPTPSLYKEAQLVFDGIHYCGLNLLIHCIYVGK
jgi:hypothetical protein